jgi:hypothetical protein
MMNREQTIRDLSAALSHAEENGVMGEIIAAIKPLHDPVDGETIYKEVQRAIDELADPIYRQADEDYEARRGNRDHLWDEEA